MRLWQYTYLFISDVWNVPSGCHADPPVRVCMLGPSDVRGRGVTVTVSLPRDRDSERSSLRDHAGAGITCQCAESGGIREYHPGPRLYDCLMVTQITLNTEPRSGQVYYSAEV
jgi:hypothetical protein